MRTTFTLCAALLAAMTALADAPRACRLDLTSEPEGATVSVDGVAKGRTPIAVWDAMPGVAHHIAFALDDYEPADIFITPGEGECIQRSVPLTAVKGLLLLTSDPSGCAVSVDGLTLGETPRLVTTLDAKDTYKVEFQKAGYVTQRQEVKFNGRTPVVRHARLVLDSGALRVESVPAGAEISVNGTVKGSAPLDVTDMIKGESVVTAKLEGYEPQTKRVSLKAGDLKSLVFEMKGLPGSLQVTVEPAGATVFVDGKSVGKAPVEVKGVATGEHEIRAEMAGFASFTKTVEVGIGQAVPVEFRLDDIKGSIEVSTQPAGAAVFLDGRQVGVTKAKGAGNRSEPFEIAAVLPGSHEVTVKLAGYGDETRTVNLDNSQAEKLAIKLKRQFTPDVEVITLGGTYRGVLISNTPEAILIETTPGVTRSFRHLDIREINFLENVK